MVHRTHKGQERAARDNSSPATHTDTDQIPVPFYRKVFIVGAIILALVDVCTFIYMTFFYRPVPPLYQLTEPVGGNPLYNITPFRNISDVMG